jgi:ABC-type Co2+ transport system permease subunit
MTWELVQTWFLSLGESYGVNPLIFGAIYVGAVPFFSASIAWLVRSYRRGRSIVPPLMAAMFFFISAYLYLIVAGRNVPVWVYGFVAILIAVGAFSTYRKVRKQIGKNDAGQI